MANIRVPKSVSQDLKEVTSIDPKQLQKFAQVLEDIDEPLLRMGELRQHIEPIVAGDAGKALSRQLVGLAMLGRARNLEVSELLDGVTEDLEKSWDETDFARWSNVREILEVLLKTRAVATVTKVLDLSFDYAYLLTGSNVITDIRPVFDPEQVKIIGAIVTQTLKISYRGDDGEVRSLGLAVDESDIENLKEACEIALRKGQISKETMLKDCNVKTFLVGEEADDINSAG